MLSHLCRERNWIKLSEDLYLNGIENAVIFLEKSSYLSQPSNSENMATCQSNVIGNDAMKGQAKETAIMSVGLLSGAEDKVTAPKQLSHVRLSKCLSHRYQPALSQLARCAAV